MISFISGYYGFLANQMFQAAATFALAKHHGTTWAFPENRPNLHELFNLSAQREAIATVNYQEPHFHFDPAFFRIEHSAGKWPQLSGYFQSERYFAPYAEQVRREFAFRETPAPQRAVSIHVRRGDYLSFPDHHPPLTMDYYRAAMAHFPGARFMVFTDDPGWCLLNFRDAGYPVEISTGRTAIEDMALMASCDHAIIANSSFSWWGAYLNRNPNKRIIAPIKWFGEAKPLPQWDTKDLIPPSWERI